MTEPGRQHWPTYIYRNAYGYTSADQAAKAEEQYSALKRAKSLGDCRLVKFVCRHSCVMADVIALPGGGVLFYCPSHDLPPEQPDGFVEMETEEHYPNRHRPVLRRPTRATYLADLASADIIFIISCKHIPYVQASAERTLRAMKEAPSNRKSVVVDVPRTTLTRAEMERANASGDPDAFFTRSWRKELEPRVAEGRMTPEQADAVVRNWLRGLEDDTPGGPAVNEPDDM